MLGIKHLRHISLFTPNFEEQKAFYQHVWNLDIVHENEQEVYFRGRSKENHILHLRRSDHRGLHHIAFAMEDKNAVDRAYEKVVEQGIRVVQKPGYLDEFGGGYGFRFLDPENRCIELSAWVENHISEWKSREVNPVRLNHVVVNTTDIDKLVDFYTQKLGFKVSDWSEHKMAFLRCNQKHHSIAFHQSTHPAMHHIAYEVENVDQLMRGISFVRQQGYEPAWGPGRHGPGNNIFCYFQDPGGFVMEYTCYLEIITDESKREARVWKRVPHMMDRWMTAGPAPKEVRKAMAGTPDYGWVEEHEIVRKK